MVAISWTATIIFGILFFVAWMNTANVHTNLSSPLSILEMLISYGFIPSILWLKTYFTSDKVKEGSDITPTSDGYSGGYTGGHNDNSKLSSISSDYSQGENNSYNNSDGYNYQENL